MDLGGLVGKSAQEEPGRARARASGDRLLSWRRGGRPPRSPACSSSCRCFSLWGPVMDPQSSYLGISSSIWQWTTPSSWKLPSPSLVPCHLPSRSFSVSAGSSSPPGCRGGLSSELFSSNTHFPGDLMRSRGFRYTSLSSIPDSMSSAPNAPVNS